VIRFASLFSLIALFCFTGCQTAPVKKAEARAGRWWHAGGKEKVDETAALISRQVFAIAQADVFQNAGSAEDALAKQFNVQGFSEAGHTLEAALPNLAIEQIPSFIAGLRQIWLPPQQHYTQLAADTGTVIVNDIKDFEAKSGRKILPAEETKIVEGVIAGLSMAQPVALKGP
jgi:hypothetical protein